MRSRVLAAVTALTCAPILSLAVEAEPTSVVEAEYAFAASAKPLGVRGAFLKWLADDAILCSPAPVNGIASTTAGKPNADTLEWYPTHAQTAGSGDLGYTTGPWTYRTADGKTEAHGTFLSVWRKQPSATWRVVLDCGVSHPKPQTEPAGLKPSSENSRPSNSRGDPNWRDPVAAADARFTTAVAREGSNALSAFASPDVRVMANGVATAVGIAQGTSLLNGQKLGTTWQHVFASQSEDGTLGYTWGYIGDAQLEKPAAAYVNVWRRESATAPWQIVAQSIQVLPKKP
jgi:ketosteroid isomerase-like protein